MPLKRGGAMSYGLPSPKFQKSARGPTDDDGDIILDVSKQAPRVPDDTYKVVFVRHELCFIFRTGKLFLWFRIVEPGPYFGTEIYASYRVQLRGKKFKVSSAYSLYKM